MKISWSPCGISVFSLPRIRISVNTPLHRVTVNLKPRQWIPVQLLETRWHKVAVCIALLALAALPVVLADARPAKPTIRVSERCWPLRGARLHVSRLGQLARAVSQDDRDCDKAHDLHDSRRVSLEGAGLSVEGSAAQKHDNFILKPVQTVPPVMPTWKAFSQEKGEADDAACSRHGCLPSPDHHPHVPLTSDWTHLFVDHTSQK